MIIVTSEFIFLNPIKKEISLIIDNTKLEQNKQYGDNDCRKIEFKYNILFSDKIKNKTENITTNRGISRTILASQA